MRKPEQAHPRRMKPLCVLPVFFDLNGKTALVAGGCVAAAWKAELLVAAGASVRVAASGEITEDLRVLIAQAPKHIRLLDRRWREDDLVGCSVAIGAFEDEEDAAQFASAARDYGVSVNIIDAPALSDFQFGSIVNRSPIVAAVSTGGAAPALAQLIRTKIETLLPPDIADWAAAAKRIRNDIRTRLPNAGRRKAFWQRFAEAAFTKPISQFDRAIRDLSRQVVATKGNVTIVGAGPGDAGLLTINAVRALQAADVILFDDLVSQEVLDLSRREAKRMLVGKRGGRASCKQDDINELMLRLARQGKRVVRLKSGDPMIFGRAGEEIAILEVAGVDVDIIPGVTAALAAAARLKTSLTHRDCAQGVKFITAHSRQGELPALDWRACAAPDTTLMVYMGGRTAPALARKLIDAGADPQTPVAIARNVSRTDEEIAATNLSQLQHKRLSSEGPVLLGIGAVFAAARKKYDEITYSCVNNNAMKFETGGRAAARIA